MAIQRACVLGALLLGVAPAAQAENGLIAAVEWRWSQPDTEIHEPSFAPDGRTLVLATRPHMPEAWAAAESKPPARLVRIWKRGAKDARFADPRVTIVAPGQKPRFLGYGWQPRFTADGRGVIFARQVNPIGHRRVLPSTLAGNDLVALDLAGGEERVLAAPGQGSPSQPDPSPDGKSVVYYRLPSDGAPSALVASLERVPLTGVATPEPLYLPRPVETAPAAFVVRHVWLGNDVIIALTTKGDRFRLTNLTAAGRPDLGSCDTPTFAATGPSLVVLDAGSWLVKDARSGAVLETRPGPAQPLRRAAASPDGRLWAHVTIAEKGRRRLWELRLLDWRTGAESRILESPKELQAISWAQDGKRLAVVAAGDPEQMSQDDLIVLGLSASPAR